MNNAEAKMWFYRNLHFSKIVMEKEEMLKEHCKKEIEAYEAEIMKEREV